MAKMIADSIERQTFGQEMAGASVAQCMGTATGSLNTQVVEATAGHVVESTGRERTERRFEGEKDLPASTLSLFQSLNESETE